ncbi:hypothetical protein BCY84_11233 [Trypanosoma cruzi cruzi]|uniref:Uncharacterized protein n=1 Tax=Trypanosoma cruzi TaxID=5693 RepID=A0A2V2UMK1_TRYCR|nr:hypothetical protein BCY84_11233 [Trypanosoma cruzi cruzi]PWU83533.1 hypothetical protein C4B63_310g1 [Trypanosoma cruzi]
MLLSQRIAALQRVELQLRRILKEEAIQRSPSLFHPGVDVRKNGEAQRRAAVKDKLLFRHVPVAVSLLERSFLSLTSGKKTAAQKRLKEHETQPPRERSTKLVPPPSQSHSGVGPASPENSKTDLQQGTILTASTALKSQGHFMRQPEYALRLLSSLHFMEQERRKLYRHHMSRLESRLQNTEQALHTVRKRREDTVALNAARDAVTEAKADVTLLQGSLLSRPYISARLWRLLLREEIWVTAVRDFRKQNGGNGLGTASSVIVMLLSLTRLGFGALQDSLKGHALNTRAPRFVASLPSRRMRRRKLARLGLKGENGLTVPASVLVPVNSNGDSRDPAMLMMMEMMTTSETAKEETPPPSSASKATVEVSISETNSTGDLMKRIPPLRWLPPSSCEVTSLVLETLAMCSHVLPLLDVTSIITCCGEAQELFDLLLVLQASASSLLVLYANEGNGEATVHQTLRRLEDAMMKCGENAKGALVTQMNEMSSVLPPVKAARLLFGLESMKLIQTEEHVSQKLLMQLVKCMFPQLSTGTQRALLEKSRQNSLFAFATRSQRAKLRREHGKQGTESAFLNSVRARARLQQRQMQAALRMKHLEEVNSQSVGQLAEELSPHSLLILFDVLVRAARDAPRRGMEVRSCFITAALFVVEAVCVARARTPSSNSGATLQPDDLPSLLFTLSVLWPLVTERYQMFRNALNDRHYNPNLGYIPRRYRGQQGSGVGDSMAKSELMIVTYVTDMVFSAVNAAIAERVQRAESVTEPNSERELCHTLSLKDIMRIVDALFEWGKTSLTNKNSISLETTARLIKRLLVTDLQLWDELRQLNETRREQFICRLSDVLLRLNMMDTTVTKVLFSVC